MSLNRQEFRALFGEQRDPLFAFLHRLTGNPSDADDLLQETFLMVWRKRHRYESLGSAGGFLRTVAFRLYLSGRRRAARRHGLAPPPAAEPTALPPDGEVARDEERGLLLARLDRAMALLPAPLREAFHLYRVRGLEVREIAALTGSPLKTVETRIRRATLSLAAALRPVARDPCANHD